MSPLFLHLTRRLLPPPRKGSYAILFAFLLVVVLGFGALALDVNYIRLAQGQAQDVADAASHAAILTFKQTNDTAIAEAAALAVVAKNKVGDRPGQLTSLTFGNWDDRDPDVFTPDLSAPNAVQAVVAREGTDSLGLFLARLWGHDSVQIRAQAASAARALQIILVVDVTLSWSQVNFANARAAAVNFLDVVSANPGERDQIGMVIFNGPFAWEYTPLFNLSDAAAVGAARADWEQLNVASGAGYPKAYPNECSLHYYYRRSKTNDFADSPDGCYPQMPRAYITQEATTDHTIGLEMAQFMFEESPENMLYRVLIMLTDGYPNQGQLPTLRAAAGHSETRWREKVITSYHSTTTIKNNSITLAEQMWDDMRVNTTVVSFVADDAFMADMIHGDGTYQVTNRSDALVSVFENIANALPMVIVK